MKLPELEIVGAGLVRRAVVGEGDIQGDIRFQNDINCLLAQLEERATPLEALGWLTTAPAESRARGGRRRVVAQRGLRVLDGGAGTETRSDAITREDVRDVSGERKVIVTRTAGVRRG